MRDVSLEIDDHAQASLTLFTDSFLSKKNYKIKEKCSRLTVPQRIN